MKASVLALSKALDELRCYIGFLDAEYNVLAMAPGGIEPTLQEVTVDAMRTALPGHATKRLYDYSCIIIVLYGALEQFIESSLRGYVRHLNHCYPKYSRIPEAVAKAHFDLTRDLMARLSDGRYKAILNPAAIVSNLSSCLSDTVPYTLNEYAFSHHSTNFRQGTIDEAFKSLNVSGITGTCRACEPFRRFLRMMFPGEDVANLKSERVFEWLNDLVDRRNEVAHGNIQQTLNNGILRQYINYCEAFGIALNAVLSSDAYRVLAEERGAVLGKPLAVYDNRVVCFTLRNCELKAGDVLIARRPNNVCPFIAGEVDEIQISGKSCSRVASWPSINVGITAGFRVGMNYEYFLVSSAF